MKEPKDLLVQSRFKNGILFDAMAGRSVHEIAEASGASLTQTYSLLNLIISPKRSDGTYRPTAQRLADYFRMLPEDLFPMSLYALNLPRVVEREYDSKVILKQLSCREAMMLPAPDGFKTIEEEERAAMLRKVLKTLSPREEAVMKLRFGLDDGVERSLEQVGQEFAITRTRVSQIENKALRKLRHPSRSRHVRVFLEGPSQSYL